MLNTNPSLTFTYKVFGVALVILTILSFGLPPLKSIILINSLHTPALDTFFSTITNLGHGIFAVPVALMLLFEGIHLTLGFVFSNVAEGLIVLVLKRVIFYPAARPITSLNLSVVHMVPGVDIHRAMSFPSGHTVTIFGISVFMCLCYKNKFLSSVLGVIATLVGLSRTYLLQHYLSDVAAGAFIGVTVGILVYHAFEQMNKPRWMNQRLQVRLKLTPSKARFS